MCDDLALRVLADASGLPLMSSLGPRETTSTKEDFLWKEDHHQICKDNNIVLPVDMTSRPITSRFDFSGLFPRERGSVVMLDTCWKPPPHGDYMEFVDINVKLPWIIQSCMIPDSEGRIDPDITPWRRVPGTLTG